MKHPAPAAQPAVLPQARKGRLPAGSRPLASVPRWGQMRTGSSSIWSAASTTPRFRPPRAPRPAAGSRSAAAPGAPPAAPSSRSQTAATPSPPQHLGRLSRAAGALAPVGWRAPRATFRRLPDPSISWKGRPCAHLHHHRPVASAAGLAAALHIPSTRGSGLRSRSRAALLHSDSHPRPRRRGNTAAALLVQ